MPAPALACLPQSHPPPSRSWSLFSFLSKIRPSLPVPTSPLPPASSPFDAAAAKQRRDAALRERGLLPPLKLNKDLSRQERDHDHQLPVVRSIEGTAVTIDSPTGVDTVTAANLIKKEWEAKNLPLDGEHERFNSFTFGGSLSPSNESGTHAGGQLSDKDTPHLLPTNHHSHHTCSRDGATRVFPHPETGLAPSSPTILHPLPSAPTVTTAKHGRNETTLELVTSIPTTPIISLSPVAEELDPKDKDVHRRKPSTSESQTSFATPSLDATSFSTGISLLGTAENSPGIKTSGVRNIPMIVESPIEESFLPEMSIPDATPSPKEPSQEYQDIQTRRKKRSLFGQDPPRRLTVSTSLTNIRRSVANTLSRTKSSLKVPKQGDVFDASHLPPSPTYPFSSLTRVSGRRSLDVSATGLRQPVSPTLHDRASIFLETSAIEDEEARRVTEMAFLD